jgi:hypothetical protein
MWVVAGTIAIFFDRYLGRDARVEVVRLVLSDRCVVLGAELLQLVREILVLQ